MVVDVSPRDGTGGASDEEKEKEERAPHDSEDVRVRSVSDATAGTETGPPPASEAATTTREISATAATTAEHPDFNPNNSSDSSSSTIWRVFTALSQLLREADRKHVARHAAASPPYFLGILLRVVVVGGSGIPAAEMAIFVLGVCSRVLFASLSKERCLFFR